MSYTATSQGQYKLYIQVNDKEIDDSPLIITVYPDPNDLTDPVSTINDVIAPYSIVFTSDGNMIVSEKLANQISIFDIKGRRIGKFESHDDSSRQIKIPQGLVIDDEDNVYVSSEYKLQRFTSSGNSLNMLVVKNWAAGKRSLMIRME